MTPAGGAERERGGGVPLHVPKGNIVGGAEVEKALRHGALHRQEYAAAQKVQQFLIHLLDQLQSANPPCDTHLIVSHRHDLQIKSLYADDDAAAADVDPLGGIA